MPVQARTVIRSTPASRAASTTVTLVPDDLSRAVATEINRLLAERDWSGRKLAREAGLPTASVAKKLAGVSVITLDDLQAFAGALGVDPTKLLSR